MQNRRRIFWVNNLFWISVNSSHILKMISFRIEGFISINADVTVNRNRTYQKNIGFGGAFTGSVSHIIEMLPKTLQNYIFKYGAESRFYIPQLRVTNGPQFTSPRKLFFQILFFYDWRTRIQFDENSDRWKWFWFGAMGIQWTADTWCKFIKFSEAWRSRFEAGNSS